MKYQLELLYELKEPIVFLDNNGVTSKWEKGEQFLLTPNRDKKTGPCFISLLDGSLLSLKVIKKISRTKPVMTFGSKTTVV
jgi:hypothetical protein